MHQLIILGLPQFLVIFLFPTSVNLLNIPHASWAFDLWHLGDIKH